MLRKYGKIIRKRKKNVNLENSLGEKNIKKITL